MNPKEEQMREFLATLAREAEIQTCYMLEVPAAIAQLTRTERGARAFLAYKQFTEQHPGLTPDNWHALAVLCHARGYIPTQTNSP